jgi:hypothetical protein
LFIRFPNYGNNLFNTGFTTKCEDRAIKFVIRDYAPTILRENDSMYLVASTLMRVLVLTGWCGFYRSGEKEMDSAAAGATLSYTTLRRPRKHREIDEARRRKVGVSVRCAHKNLESKACLLLALPAHKPLDDCPFAKLPMQYCSISSASIFQCRVSGDPLATAVTPTISTPYTIARKPAPAPVALSNALIRKRKHAALQTPDGLGRPPDTCVPPITTTATDNSM